MGDIYSPGPWGFSGVDPKTIDELNPKMPFCVEEIRQEGFGENHGMAAYGSQGPWHPSRGFPDSNTVGGEYSREKARRVGPHGPPLT